MVLPTKVLLALLPFFIQQTASQASGTGKTTRYWDCCKASCGWTKKVALAPSFNPVVSCDINDNPLSNYDAKSGCDGGGPSYMCTSQMPWAVNDNLAYGFAAVNIAGGNEASWCCACYELTFTSGPVSGKKMIVQATNTGGDLGNNHFDIAMPGGGFGIFNGCTTQWGTPSTGWGAQYGGISSRSQCDAFNSKLKAGCYWRFDWFQNADNPNVSFRQITCPAALTNKTGCVRQGEVPTNEQPPSSTTTTRAVATTSSPVVVPTTTTRPAVTTSPSATPNVPNPGPLAQRYGQCGGSGWTGPTACVTPYSCVVVNQWYSQCL